MELDLISALQSLTIQNSSNTTTPQQPFTSTLDTPTDISVPRRQPHHELNFIYPCETALPPGSRLRLDAPLGWSFLSRQPTTSAPVHILPQHYFCLLAGPRQGNSTDPLTGDALKLYTDLEVLATFAGQTKLNIISVEKPDGKVLFHVQRETVVYGSEVHNAEQTTTYTISPRSFQHLMNSGSEWARVLSDLVRRKSELAKHVVRVAAGPVADEWMQAAEAQVPRFASAILFDKCKDLAMEDDDNCVAMLPCGHMSLVPKRCLRIGGNQTESMNFRCEHCRQFVLTVHETEEAGTAQNTERARQWIQEQTLWAALDQRDLNDQYEVQVPRKTLTCVVAEAMSSLEFHRGIVPASQSPFKSEETVHAMNTVREWLGNDQDGEVRASIRDIRAHLKKIIEGSLRATSVPANVFLVPKPPGWPAMLELWMDRAMKFLQYRVYEQCGGFGNESDGVHYHDGKNDLVYTAAQDKQQVDCGDIEEAMVGMTVR